MLQKMLDTQKRIRTTTRVIHEEKMMGSHDLNQRGFYTSKIMFTTSFFFLSRKADQDPQEIQQQLPPISLCSQFRQVYLQAPDIGPLVQAELLARGFGQPKTLTNSLMAIIKTFYKITTPGFRHIPMLTITREIFSRLPSTDKTESSHVATATMDTMRAMLPATGENLNHDKGTCINDVQFLGRVGGSSKIGQGW